jgi:hypothetical protein
MTNECPHLKRALDALMPVLEPVVHAQLLTIFRLDVDALVSQLAAANAKVAELEAEKAKSNPIQCDRKENQCATR